MSNFMFERVNNKALGQLLVEKGIITSQQLEEALGYAHIQNIRLGDALKQLQFVSNDNISFAIGEQFGMTPVMISSDMIDLDLLNRFPADLLRKHIMLPFVEVGDEIVVLISDPQDIEGLRQFGSFVPSKRVTPQLGDAEQILSCIDTLAPAPDIPTTTNPLQRIEAAGTQPIAQCNLDGPAPEPGEPSFVNWMLALTLQDISQDVLIRYDSRSTLVFSQVPSSIAKLTTSSNIHEVSASLFPILLNEIYSHCVALSPLNNDVFRWRAPLRFAGSRYSIEFSVTHDIGSSFLRLRPYQLLEKIADPAAILPYKSRKLTLALFDSPITMQQYILNIVSFVKTSPLIIQQMLRGVIRGTTAYPAGYAKPSQLAAHYNARIMIFDHPVPKADLANIQFAMLNPPDIHICVLIPDAGTLAPSQDAIDLLTTAGSPFCVLDCRHDNIAGIEIDKNHGLRILNGKGA